MEIYEQKEFIISEKKKVPVQLIRGKNHYPYNARVEPVERLIIRLTTRKFDRKYMKYEFSPQL